MPKVIRSGQVKLVIPERVIDQTIEDMKERNQQFRKMSQVVAATQPDTWMVNPRVHQVKRLRYAEPWRGSGSKSPVGTTVTDEFGCSYNTAISLETYGSYKAEREAREQASNRVKGKG